MIKIYTDGACIGNPGPGGWAFIIKYDNGELKYSITAFNCYKPETDQYFPANPASNSILTSSFKLELIISIYNPSNIKLEEYTVNRYVFNPYIYTENA